MSKNKDRMYTVPGVSVLGLPKEGVQNVDVKLQKLHGAPFAMKFYGGGRVDIIYADGTSHEFATKGYIVLVAEVYGEEAYEHIIGEFASKEEAKFFIAKEVEEATKSCLNIKYIKEFSTGTELVFDSEVTYIYKIR